MTPTWTINAPITSTAATPTATDRQRPIGNTGKREIDGRGGASGSLTGCRWRDDSAGRHIGADGADSRGAGTAAGGGVGPGTAAAPAPGSGVWWFVQSRCGGGSGVGPG